MRLDLEELRPEEHSWFSPNVEYHGTGRADFAEGRGSAEGEVTIVFDEFGGDKIEMEVKRLTGPEPQPKGISELIASRRFPEPGGGVILFHGFHNNPCVKLVVDTDAGVFSIVGPIDYDVRSGEGCDRISMHPRISEFVCREGGRPKYWILPLLNFVSDFSWAPEALSNHPLRVFRTPAIPDGLPEEEALKAFLYANSRNHLIAFTFGGSLGFIEPLADYADREAKLRGGSVRRLVTAVVVGEVGENSTEVKSLESWFPHDMLRVLSFATGIEVGAPWIEFRDESSRLVRRVHAVHNAADLTEGHRTIREGIHRGTGRLLTCFLSSQSPSRSYVGIAMYHAVRAWRCSTHSIEEKLIYVVRGLECLCARLSAPEPELRMRLGPTKRALVAEILNDAARRIRSLATSPRTSAEQEENSALCEIATRASTTPWGKAGAFGLAVVDLLNKFGLADGIVLDTYFASTPVPGTATENWASWLSRARGEPIHGGFFDIASGDFRIEDLVSLARHLHDVLVRIILRVVNYDGTYQPTVFPGAVQATVDWVKPSTPASHLGYGQYPENEA